MDPFNIAIVIVTWVMMLAVGLAVDAKDLAVWQRRPGLVAGTLVAHWLILPPWPWPPPPCSFWRHARSVTS
ncbi:MAG: hypothetical protein ACKV19_23105 [Verrucomicrobiales bacterium]